MMLSHLEFLMIQNSTSPVYIDVMIASFCPHLILAAACTTLFLLNRSIVLAHVMEITFLQSCSWDKLNNCGNGPISSLSCA